MTFFLTLERDKSYILVFWMLNTNPISKVPSRYNVEKTVSGRKKSLSILLY